MENTLKRSQTLTIGGVEHEVEFLFIHRKKIIRWFSVYLLMAVREFRHKNKRDPLDSDPIVVSNDFFFKCTWLILKKRGVWPFRKPFRSRRVMVKNILNHEYQAIVDFISNTTLDYKAKVNSASGDSTVGSREGD